MNTYSIKEEGGMFVAYRTSDGEKLGFVPSDSLKDRKRLANAINKHGWSEAKK